MAYIEKHKRIEIGDWVKTTKEHSLPSGMFEIGTRVKVIGIDDWRGYAIEDEEGHKMIEIGWVI